MTRKEKQWGIKHKISSDIFKMHYSLFGMWSGVYNKSPKGIAHIHIQYGNTHNTLTFYLFKWTTKWSGLT